MDPNKPLTATQKCQQQRGCRDDEDCQKCLQEARLSCKRVIDRIIDQKSLVGFLEDHIAYLKEEIVWLRNRIAVLKAHAASRSSHVTTQADQIVSNSSENEQLGTENSSLRDQNI